MTTAPEEVGGAAPTDLTPGGVLTRRAPATTFEVSLDNFTGPFDLLLGLISKPVSYTHLTLPTNREV